jgi:hypothetical protein
MYKENIVVLYSGGMGSFLATKAIQEISPESNITLYFNDTYLERIDLYRFILDTVNHFWKSENYPYLAGVLKTVPELISTTTNDDMKRRKKILSSWGNLMMLNYPKFVYDADGRDVWEVFTGVGYIGNTRLDPCSRVLRRERSSNWLKNNMDESSTDVAIGIDWSEIHRWKRAKKRWEFNLVAPLIDAKKDRGDYEKEILLSTGIKRSSAYDDGLPHDNCGGFCVKAGLAHFKILLESNRERYLYHERKLEEAIGVIGRHPFLRKWIKGKTEYITLKEYREYIDTGKLYINGELRICDSKDDESDSMEFGGCGCAI